MLLCKIMLSAPDDVNALLSGKAGIRHAGPGLEAMRAVATAHRERSLHDFEAVLSAHASELTADAIVSSHLASLYDILLQDNICRIIEPYSVVEVPRPAARGSDPCPRRPKHNLRPPLTARCSLVWLARGRRRTSPL